MSELGVMDLGDLGAGVVGGAPVAAQIAAKLTVPGGPSVKAASPVVPGAPAGPLTFAAQMASQVAAKAAKPCPAGYKTAVSKYTGRRLCVPPTPAKKACPPGYMLKFYPMTRKIACAPVPGVAAAQMRAAYRKKMQAQAQKQASRLSTLRTLPGLDEPSQGIKQIAQGGPMGAKQAMVIAAQRRLQGERAQTATMSKLIQHWTGIPQDVNETQVGTGIKKAYTPGAYTSQKGWMPGCKMVCPGGPKPALPKYPVPAKPPSGLVSAAAGALVGARQQQQVRRQAQHAQQMQMLQMQMQKAMQATQAGPAHQARPTMGARVRVALPVHGK